MIKNVCDCAIFYLIPKSAPQRVFAAAVLGALTTLIGLYIWYTLTLRFDDETSWIYKRHAFRLSDHSYAEYVGYVLESFTALIFTLKAYRDRQFLWLNWTVIFMIILIDDSLQLHETFGDLIQGNSGISKNIGEIFGFAWLGLFVTAFWLSGLYKAIRDARGQLPPYLVFTIYLGLMIFFGVFVDAFHVFISRFNIIPDAAAELVEDGGELFAMCLCAVSALKFYTQPRITSL